MLTFGYAAPAQADQYPSKPIRLVVPYPPGGTADIVSRVFAQELASKLGQPIVVENRPGATGRIGSESVMRSPHDGYTLVTAVISSHGIAPALSKNYGFDPLKDFVPVIRLGGSPVTMFARRGLPANTVGEVIAFARANPGKIMAPAGTPPAIVKRLNDLGNEVLAMPDVRKRYADMAYEVGGGTAEEFGAEIRTDLDRFRRLNETLNINTN